MPKKQQPKKSTKQKNVTADALLPLHSTSTSDKIVHFFSNRSIQLLLIIIITYAFYSNSIKNNFAQDDGQFYTSNQFVQKGISGIYDLFTKESMYGYYAQASVVSGGRWRPLSLITFAMEKEFFDSDPHYSHFINMLLLAITGVIMLFFLRQYIFSSSPFAAFMATLLFIIHPVHTEAVSHIKSRDELLSWLFLLLTMYCSLNFLTKRNYRQLLLSLLCYFLALLSKENGVTFIIILPLTYYFFTKEKLRSIVLTTLPFAVVLGIYILIRLSFVSFLATTAAKDVDFAPYLFATSVQHIATALMLLGKYILLLFWPNPLNSNYAYKVVPYVNFSDWRVWLSVLIQAALVVYALLKLKEKSLVSYGILFYFCSIFMVSNLVIDVGTFLGERFLYQASFGFCIAIVATTNELVQKIKFKTKGQKYSIISLLIAAIVGLSCFQTTSRNAEWNNNMLLFITDVKTAPNSMELHANLGTIFLDSVVRSPTLEQRNNYFNRAKAEFDTAITLLPTYAINWFNLGYLNSLMGNNDAAAKAYINCINADSAFSQGYNGLGSIYYHQKNYEEALTYFKKGAQLDSSNAQFYFNMGLCYRYLGDYEKEIPALKKSLQLISNLQDQRVNFVNPQLVNQDILEAENQLQNKKQ